MTKLQEFLGTKKGIILLIALIVLITASGAGAWYYNRLGDLENLFPELDWSDNGEEHIPGVDEVFDRTILNILFLGFDGEEAREEKYVTFRPDTIMVAAINLKNGDVDLLSIPRDLVVRIYNMNGRDKINQAYYYGWRRGSTPEERHQLGLESQIETISMALGGVPIHYYVTIDMDGVREVVDIMGGVKYDVPHNIYHNRTGRLMVAKGEQILNGNQLLWVVRNRQYRDGDFTRIRNQQDVLIAAFEQFRSAGKLIYAPQVYASVRNHVDTNLNVEQMAALALFATRYVNTEKIATHALTGAIRTGRLTPTQTRSYSYVIIDNQSYVDIIRQIWGLTVPPLDDTFYPPLPTEDPDEDPSDSPPVLVDDEGAPAEPGEPGVGDPDQESGQDNGSEEPGDDGGEDLDGDEGESDGDEEPGNDKGADSGGEEDEEDDNPGDGDDDSSDGDNDSNQGDN